MGLLLYHCLDILEGVDFAVAGEREHGVPVLVGHNHIETGDELSQFDVEPTIASQSYHEVMAGLYVFL